jgi:hypothetical protein
MASFQGRGSLTEGVPDYTDPDVEIRNLLQSPNYRDRRRGKLLLEQRGHELARNQQREEFYFRQEALKNQLGESQQSRADINRENEAGRMERARQHNELVRISQEDNRTRNLISAMNAASYDQSPEGKALLRSLQAEYAKTIGIPTGAAPTTTPAAGGKGEFGPGGTPAPTGGKGEYGPGGAPAGAPAPTTPMATNNQYNQPTAAFTQPSPNVGPTGAVDQGLGFAPNGYPILPNTPEPRYVPLGTNPLDYSTAVPGGIRTPSGGFIGGASAQRRVADQTNVLNPPPNEAMAAAPVGEGYTPPTAAFTQPAPSNAPQPTPAGAPTPPAKIQIGLGNAPPVDVATLNYTGGPSNAAQDAAQREEMRRRGIQPPPYRF